MPDRFVQASFWLAEINNGSPHASSRDSGVSAGSFPETAAGNPTYSSNIRSQAVFTWYLNSIFRGKKASLSALLILPISILGNSNYEILHFKR